MFFVPIHEPKAKTKFDRQWWKVIVTFILFINVFLIFSPVDCPPDYQPPIIQMRLLLFLLFLLFLLSHLAQANIKCTDINPNQVNKFIKLTLKLLLPLGWGEWGAQKLINLYF